MSEFISAITTIWCSVTYWLGGQEIPFVGHGFKWVRRYVMPIGLFMGLLFLGAVWWKALFSCALLSAGTHIGYGTRFWKLPLTAAVMTSGVIVLYWPEIPPWWAAIPITYHTAYGFLSRKYPKFLWAYVALLMGMGLGIVYTSAI